MALTRRWAQHAMGITPVNPGAAQEREYYMDV